MRIHLKKNGTLSYEQSKQFFKKLPQFQKQFSILDDEMPKPKDLQTIESYINDNIKSKRRSIMDLYSKNLMRNQKGQIIEFPCIKHLKPEKSRNKSKLTGNVIHYQRSMTIDPPKHKKQVLNDKDFIVNNVFSYRKKKSLQYSIQNPTIHYLNPRNQPIKNQALALLNKMKQQKQQKRMSIQEKYEQKSQELPKISHKLKVNGASIKKISCSQTNINPWENAQMNQELNFKVQQQ